MIPIWSCGHFVFFFSSRRRHTRCSRDWSSDVCSSDLLAGYYLADILTNQKNYREAIPLLQMVTAAYPELKEAYFLLGKCYAGTGEDQRALEAFNKALQLNPNYKEAHYQLYGLYAHLGDKKNSAAQLRIFEELIKKGQEEDEFRLRETPQKQTKAG